MNEEVSPYEELIRLLTQRLGRQASALKDTEEQLRGARQADLDWRQHKLDLKVVKK